MGDAGRAVIASLVLATAACELHSTAPQSPLGLGASVRGCFVHGSPRPAACFTYTVSQDRAAAAGRTIDLGGVIIPASGDARADDPIVYFHGGPGGSSVDQSEWVLDVLGELVESRDVVLIDQRGTGRSGRLDCRGPLPSGEISLFGALFPPDHVEQCRSILEAGGADLRHYATPDAVDDMAEVLTALGYDRVNLFGASYGTRMALVFLRRHPGMVRTALLNGVAPPHVNVHLEAARNVDEALGWLALRCAADPACGADHPDGLRDGIDRLLDRFAAGPIPIDTELSDGTDVTAPFARGDFGYAIRGMLYGALADSISGWVAKSLSSGGWAGFPRYYLGRSGWVASDFATGMHLSVFCTEDYPLPADSEVADATSGTVLGETLARRYEEACARWPAGDVPAGYHEPVRSDAPVLIVSGERDPVTPARWGDDIATTLSRSLHVVVPDAGHVPLGDCVLALQRSFFERGSVDGLTGC